MSNIDFSEYAEKTMRSVDISKLTYDGFEKFMQAVVFANLSRAIVGTAAITGGTGMYVFYNMDRSSSDIDLRILIGSKENYNDSTRKRKFDTALEIISDNISKDFKDLLTVKVTTPRKATGEKKNSSYKKILQISTMEDNPKKIEILFDGMDSILLEDARQFKQLELKSVRIFQRDYTFNTMHPLTNYYNKIHRMHKLTPEKFDKGNTDDIANKLTDIYDIYVLSEMKDEDKAERLQHELDEVKSVVSFDDEPFESIAAIKKNIVFIKKSKDCERIFINIIKATLKPGTPYLQSDSILKDIFKKGCALIEKGAADLEKALNANREDIEARLEEKRQKKQERGVLYKVMKDEFESNGIKAMSTEKFIQHTNGWDIKKISDYLTILVNAEHIERISKGLYALPYSGWDFKDVFATFPADEDCYVGGDYILNQRGIYLQCPNKVTIITNKNPRNMVLKGKGELVFKVDSNFCVDGVDEKTKIATPEKAMIDYIRLALSKGETVTLSGMDAGSWNRDAVRALDYDLMRKYSYRALKTVRDCVEKLEKDCKSSPARER